jgi:hypothetical protein
MLLPPFISRQRAVAVEIVHTQERGGSWQFQGQMKISTKGEGPLTSRDDGEYYEV